MSGCTGVNSNGDVEGLARTGSPTPVATWNPVDSPARASELFSLESLNWYKYRFDITSNIVNMSYAYRFDYSNETYNGVEARHIKVAIYNVYLDNSESLSSITDVYKSKIDNKVLGGHTKVYSLGKVINERDLTVNEAEHSLRPEMAYQALSDGDGELTLSGQETIALNGKTYDCKKYTHPSSDTTHSAHTIWYTSQAPAPIIISYTTHGSERDAVATMRLLEWG